MEMNTCSFNTAIQSQSLAGNWSLPHLASLSHSLTRIFGAETKRNSGKVAAWSDPKSSTVCVCSSLAEAEGSRTAQGHWIFTLVITRPQQGYNETGAKRKSISSQDLHPLFPWIEHGEPSQVLLGARQYGESWQCQTLSVSELHQISDLPA